MFSKWLQTAKESASQLITAANSVIQETAQSIQVVGNDLSERANTYISENILKTPEDCTYVTSNIIVMGFPGNPRTRKLEGHINNRESIAYYLETRHPHHFKLFNLTEEEYDTLLFSNSVSNYNFTGYSSPSLGLLFQILLDIESYLEESDENVAVVHDFDGTGRAIMVSAAFIYWKGWLPSMNESLQMCLTRRSLPIEAMLPSQLRFLDYFDSIMQGNRPSAEWLRLSRVTVSNLPGMNHGTVSPIIEVFNRNRIVFTSYRKGSRKYGSVTPINENETAVFKPDCLLQGNVFVRCRHLHDNEKQSTIFRLQFETGFIKLFKLDLDRKGCDVNVEVPETFHIVLDFTPVDLSTLPEQAQQMLQEGDSLGDQLTKDNSALWTEIMRHRSSDEAEKEGVESHNSPLVEDVQKDEEEPLSEAKELENMLKSFESDLNLDSINTSGEVEDFNIEEYESVLKKQEDMYCCLFLITAVCAQMKIDNMKGFLSVLFAVFLTSVAASSVNQRLSFSAPFTSFTQSGSRYIDSWKCSGDAVINEYFIRLTPDRQSKNGYCWSMNPLTNGEWVTTIKFRISGQGANLFGDGFSVFFTQASSYHSGKMYGVDDVFKGFAIAFSTFKNTEFSRYHRDISLYVGDGKTGAYIQDRDHAGCYSRYRFHEKRQDFSVDNYAVVKIGYSATTGMVRVAIDEKNTGNFHICLNERVDLDANWWKKAYIGISATTGQLADNHDILSVETVEGEGDPDNVQVTRQEDKEKASDSQALQQLLRENNVDVTRLSMNERAIIHVMEKLQTRREMEVSKLKREVEHTLVSVDDSLNNMIKKLKQRGDVSEGRIAELEASLKNKVQTTLSMDLEERLKFLEGVVNSHVASEVKKNSGKWIIPFVLLVVVIAIALGVAYNKYVYLQKAHVL